MPDEIYKAKVQKRYTGGQWIDKLDNGGYSTFFPENWNKQRTLEEIAFAYKNKEPVQGTIHLFEEVSTNGVNIRFVIRNNEITTVYPF